MSEYYEYYSCPAFQSSRVDVGVWSGVSCEDAMLAGLLRGEQLNAYPERPAIAFRDSRMRFFATALQLLNNDVPDAAYLAALVGYAQNLHFTGDDVSWVRWEDSYGNWLVGAQPTNIYLGAPTPQEISAYVLAVSGFLMNCAVTQWLLPSAQIVFQYETFYMRPEMDGMSGSPPFTFAILGHDDYEWTETQADSVSSDLTTLWTANTPGP